MSYVTGLLGMAVLDFNYVIRYSHTWSTSFTTQPGNGPSMLSDDDVTSLCKSSGSLTTPTIEIDWGTGRSVNAIGVANHNFRSSGVSNIYFEYWDGGAWQNCDFPGSDAYSFSGQADRDFAVIFQSISATKFRLRFNETPTQNIYVGYIYLGTYSITPNNPAHFVQRRRTTVKYIQSAGGTSHAIVGAKYEPAELELIWNRTTLAVVDVMLGNNAAGHRKDFILGIVPPEQTPDALQAPMGQQIFFGRVDEYELEPLTPSNILFPSGMRYRLYMRLQGAA